MNPDRDGPRTTVGDDDAGPPAGATRGDPTVSRRDGAGYDVLLVEDNPADVRLAMEAFSEYDRDVRTATSGEEALAEFEAFLDDPRKGPRLVLLDLDLPGPSGLDLLERIADCEAFDLPVVVLTNSRAPADVRAAYEADANAYLTKPDDFDAFVEMIESVERFWLRSATVPTKR